MSGRDADSWKALGGISANPRSALRDCPLKHQQRAAEGRMPFRSKWSTRTSSGEPGWPRRRPKSHPRLQPSDFRYRRAWKSHPARMASRKPSPKVRSQPCGGAALGGPWITFACRGSSLPTMHPGCAAARFRIPARSPIPDAVVFPPCTVKSGKLLGPPDPAA
jgi:hypothetical protein